MRRILVALTLLTVLGLPAPAAEAGCGTPKRAYPEHRATPGRPPLAIGDSVMLGAVQHLARIGYQVDARGCRQMREALRIVRRRRRAGTLPRLVVISVGANWVVEPRQIREALHLLGPKRILGLVTPVELGGYGGADARVMRRADRRHPKRIKLLDWVRYRRRGWAYSDGIHLTPAGRRGFARLLRKAIPLNAPPSGSRGRGAAPPR
jgi:hypothetical protein